MMDINNNNLDKQFYFSFASLKYRPPTKYLTGVMVLKPTHYQKKKRTQKKTERER